MVEENGMKERRGMGEGNRAQKWEWPENGLE
jgi:hypothetical protein